MSLQILSEGSKAHPKLAFEKERNAILIQGWSFCENPIKFYEPITKILDTMLQEEVSPITIDIELKCFNTASSKFFVDLARKMKTNDAGQELANKVCWYYDENDLETLEWGQDIAMASGVNIELIPSGKVNL